MGKLDYLDAMEERIRFFQEKGLKELEEIILDE